MLRWIIILICVCLVKLEAKLDPNDPKYAWMDEQIKNEFLRYESSGISKEMLDVTEEKVNQRFAPGWHAVRYKVINSIIYGPGGPAKEMLEELERLYTLPYLEILFFMGDGIPILIDMPGPILSSTKHKDVQNVILYHDWYFYISRKENNPTYDWATTYKEIELLSSCIPWAMKKDQLFWRGKFHSHHSADLWNTFPRGKLCYLSLSHPELIDAGAVDLYLEQMRDAQGNSIYKFFADHEQHMRYKYQIDLDGATCTYPGLQWKLLSNCTVFKHESNDIMWYHSQLIPWVHYIPVKRNLEDLVDKIEWARNHDAEARDIAENGQKFVRDNLMPEHIALYCYKVLCAYAKLQTFQPE